MYFQAIVLINRLLPCVKKQRVFYFTKYEFVRIYE